MFVVVELNVGRVWLDWLNVGRVWLDWLNVGRVWLDSTSVGSGSRLNVGRVWLLGLTENRRAHVENGWAAPTSS
ncbi:hypothetical protein [Labilithrix luteola]|uniref:hypothetical protein n=1 Tax=Labilithrix luteola TaxID=1391654 RepID=UPI001473787C|nr:hypothetical protein [Labilithrix luteola]